MEALWNLEDKWKVSTKKAIVLFSSTSLLVIGICLVAAVLKIIRRRRNKYSSSWRKGIHDVHQQPYYHCKDRPIILPTPRVVEAAGQRSVVVEVLMGSVRWSGPINGSSSSSSSETREIGRRPTPILQGGVKRSSNIDHQVDGILGGSHNSTSAVWQRPILMGEKCELPRFSGLILYDQRGTPLHHQYCHHDHNLQDQKVAGVERTTLRDLL